MKKYLLLMLLAFGMIATTQINAQSVKMATAIGGTKYVDTTDNTETNYMYYRIPSSTTSFTVSLFLTRISGTPNGCVTLEFSNSPTFDATTFYTFRAADTVHVSTVTTLVQHWPVNLPASTVYGPVVWVRVKSVGRGTNSCKFNTFFYAKN